MSKRQAIRKNIFLPHSNFMTRSKQAGEARGKVPIGDQFGQYSEDDAITYFVYDAQKAGTEYRYLADVEKSLYVSWSLVVSMRQSLSGWIIWKKKPLDPFCWKR